MRTTAYLHLSDVHYPDTKDPLRHVDKADDAFAEKLTQYSSPHHLINVVEAMIGEIERRDFEGLILAGDLTHEGDQAGYRECVEYLERCLKETPLWQNRKLHVVAGNHDVNRHVQLGHRFANITSSWKDTGLRVFKPLSVRCVNSANGRTAVSVFSLNSCYGCGDTRRIPKKVQEQLKKALEDAVEEHEWEDVFELVGEELDTPALNEDHVTEATSAISQMPADSVALVVAHHGLLPQAFPRYAIYTELINGGMARSRLATLGTPIIYLHGHIHDDPIEVVLDPESPGSGLVCVSAPELEKGFNVLKLVYSDSDVFLGVEIERHRLHRHGGVAIESIPRIPLWTADTVLRAGDDTDRTILQLLTLDFKRFRVLRQEVEDAGCSVEREELAIRLEQLEWLQLVDIDSRSNKPQHWVVRRAGPL